MKSNEQYGPWCKITDLNVAIIKLLIMSFGQSIRFYRKILKDLSVAS